MRLPVKGPTTGSIIGGIIGVILLIAIIATTVVMVRKHRMGKDTDSPPSHKPPPPKKTNGSTGNMNISRGGVSESQPLSHMHYETQNAEPVTDLDSYADEVYEHSEEPNYSAPADWEEPTQHVDPPLYNGQQDWHDDRDGAEGEERTSQTPPSTRGGSFMSAPMYV